MAEVKKITNIEDIPGIGPSTASKLKDAGYDSLETVAYCLPSELEEVGGVGEGTAVKIINAARDALEMGFETGDKVLERRLLIEKISTGSKEFDALLGGGVETQAITECFGKFGSGKCVSKDTPLLFFNPGVAHLDSIKNVYEKYKTIEEATDGGFASIPSRDVHVMSLDANGVMAKQKIKYLFKEFVENIAVVKTNRGAVLETTKNHPLLTFCDEGLVWKPVGMLREGDFIASAKELTFSSASELTEEDAYFIGLFVAEGTSNPLSITNFDEKIVNKVKDYVTKKFGREPTISRNGHLVLLFKEVETFLGSLATTKSATKFVPETVLNGNSTVIGAFLAGYLDGDGCVEPSIIEYTTKSETLSRQIPYLLSRLGVETTLSMKGTFYRGYVTDPKSKAKLASFMSLATKSFQGETKNKSNNYGLPSKTVSNIARRVFSKMSGSHRRNQELSKKSFSQEEKVAYLNYLAKTPSSNTLTRETLETILEVFREKLVVLNELKAKLENADETVILDSFKHLPFKSTEIAKKAGLTKNALENYLARQRIPQERLTSLKQSIRDMITQVLEDEELAKDIKTLETLSNAKHLGWEKITSIQEKPYNDFVYDLTVENTHNFVGGIKPMLLHNSQLGFQLCVNAQLPKEKGGLEASVMFIDTESTFRPERIGQMAEAAGLDPAKVLANIHVARAYNSDHQMLLLEKAEDFIREKGVKVIIVDSLTSAFRSDYSGRGELAERQQKLNKHMHTLLRISDQYNVAVYITNQVMDRPDILFGDPTTPIGGHVLAHTSTYRVYLRRSKDDKRIAKLVDSPNLPDNEIVFRVTPEGLKDVD